MPKGQLRFKILPYIDTVRRNIFGLPSVWKNIRRQKSHDKNPLIVLVRLQIFFATGPFIDWIDWRNLVNCLFLIYFLYVHWV